RRSAYSGKNDRTGSSIPLMMRRSMAMPSSRAMTLFVAERSSCRTSGPNAILPSGRPHASSLPEKYCSRTSEPRRATSTAWTLLSFEALSHLTIGQSTALDRPTLSGAATDHWSVPAIGKPQLSSASASGDRIVMPIAAIRGLLRNRLRLGDSHFRIGPLMSLRKAGWIRIGRVSLVTEYQPEETEKANEVLTASSAVRRLLHPPFATQMTPPGDAPDENCGCEENVRGCAPPHHGRRHEAIGDYRNHEYDQDPGLNSHVSWPVDRS